jgi:hypothetical protein
MPQVNADPMLLSKFYIVARPSFGNGSYLSGELEQEHEDEDDDEGVEHGAAGVDFRNQFWH